MPESSKKAKEADLEALFGKKSKISGHLSDFLTPRGTDLFLTDRAAFIEVLDGMAPAR